MQKRKKTYKKSGVNGEKQPLPPLWTKHIDSGVSVIWWDATGKVIRSEDEKGAVGLSAYGALSRPSFSWAKDNGLEDFTVRMVLVYGDDSSHGPVNPKTTNHLGQAYKNYDESGLDAILAYDFKGNVLSGKKQVIKDSLLIDTINAGASNNWEVAPYRVDWTTIPWNEETNLLEGNYETDNVFDALNRPTQTIYPEDINHVRKVATTTYNRAGALQKLEYDGVDYIEHIAYDAKGGIIMTAYGNGIMTRSLYDRTTFRLKRVRTSAFIRSAWTFNDNAGVKEDKVFTYDLQGNIVSTHDKCTDCGLPSSPDDLTRNFTYDSIYRLLTATGRESNTQPSSDVWNDAAPTPSPNAQNCRTYTQVFEYDKLGNILKKIHSATGNSFTRRYNNQLGTNKLLNIDNSQPTPTVIASFSYDVKGNQTLCQSEKHYEWDYADRMRAFYNQTGTGVEPTVYAVYLYDGGGNRTKKLVRKQSGTWESVTYVGGSFEYHKKGTEEKNYTQIANVEIRTGGFTGDGSETILYQLKDHLGSVGLRLNHSGSTIDREEYYPFGDSSLRTFTKKRYRYCGKEKDEESGLYYYGARYYMSWAARFISIDPLAADYTYLTPYCYAGNKPIISVDENGMNGGENDPDPPTKNDNIGGDSFVLDSTLPQGEDLKEGQIHIKKNAVTGGGDIKYIYHSGSKYGNKGWRTEPSYNKLIEKGIDDMHKSGGRFLADFMEINSESTDQGWRDAIEKGRYASERVPGSLIMEYGWQERTLDKLTGEYSEPYEVRFSGSPALQSLEADMFLLMLPVPKIGLFGKTAGKGGSFGEKLFLSEKFGITSERFANSITGVKGTWNNQGGLLKMGWSTQSKYGGGMQLRIGIGSKVGNPNQAWKHIYVPKTFVPNNFANPSIQVKQSLFKLGL